MNQERETADNVTPDDAIADEDAESGATRFRDWRGGDPFSDDFADVDPDEGDEESEAGEA